MQEREYNYPKKRNGLISIVGQPEKEALKMRVCESVDVILNFQVIPLNALRFSPGIKDETLHFVKSKYNTRLPILVKCTI